MNEAKQNRGKSQSLFHFNSQAPISLPSIVYTIVWHIFTETRAKNVQKLDPIHLVNQQFVRVRVHVRTNSNRSIRMCVFYIFTEQYSGVRRQKDTNNTSHDVSLQIILAASNAYKA